MHACARPQGTGGIRPALDYAGLVPYTDLDARQQLLEGLAQAGDELAQALSSLDGAYEGLDEQQADRLDTELFRPLRRAYGRAQRAHAEFAARHGLPPHTFEVPPPGAPSTGVKGFIEAAVEAVDRAEVQLVGIQDSLMPIEVGDADLRAGISEVRQLIEGASQSARSLLRTFGR
jgi:hypothetical protein